MLWCAALLLALTTECEAGWSSRGWTSRSSGSWWGGSRSSSSSHWSKKSSSHWSKKSKSKGWTKSWTKTKTKTNDRCRTAWVRGTVPTCIGSIQSCLPRSNSDGWTNQVHKGSQRLTMFADAEGCRTSGATVVGGAVVRVSDQSMEVQLEQTSGWTVGTTSMWIGTSMLPVVRRRYYSANPSYFPYKMSGNETQRFRFRSGRLPQKLYVAMQVEVCEIEVVTPPPGPEDECRIAWVRGRKPRCFRGLRGCEWETGPAGWTNTLYRGREEMDLVTASTCHSRGVTSGAVVVEMTGREVDVTLGVNDGWRVDSAAMHIGREKLPRRYNGWYTASPKAFPFQSTRDGLHKFKIVSGRSQCLYIAVWVKVCRVVVTVPPGTLPPPGTPTPAVVTVPPTPGTPAPPTVPITAPPVPPTGTVPPSPPTPPTGTVPPSPPTPPTPPTGTVPPSPPTPPTPPTGTVPPSPPTPPTPPTGTVPPTPPTGTVPPSPPTPPTPGTPAPPTVPITAPPVPPTGTVPPSPPTPPTGTVPPSPPTPPTGTVPPSPPTPPTPPTGTVPPSPPTPPTGTVPPSPPTPPTPPTGTVPPSPPTPPTGTVPPTPPTTEPEPCVEEDVDVGAVVPSETVEGARTIVDWGEGRSVEEGMPGWPVGEVDTTITNIPAGLLRSRTRTFVPVSPAGLPEDSRVRVECPESCTGAPCEVVIAVYQCGACSANTNGGLPTLLPAAGWEVGNCAPTFRVGTSINYRMATYRTTVPAGQTLETPRLTQQLTNVAVFVRQGATDCAAPTTSAACNALAECRWNAGSNSCEADWCPASRTNTTGEATCSDPCVTPPPATRPPVPTPTGEGGEPAPTPRPTPTGEGGEVVPTPRPTPDNGGEGGEPVPTPRPTDNGGEGGQPEPTDNGGEGGEAVTTPDNGGEPTFG